MTTENPTPEYETPQVTDHGDLVELTAATNAGTFADAPIPMGGSIVGHLTSAP